MGIVLAWAKLSAILLAIDFALVDTHFAVLIIAPPIAISPLSIADIVENIILSNPFRKSGFVVYAIKADVAIIAPTKPIMALAPNVTPQITSVMLSPLASL